MTITVNIGDADLDELLAQVEAGEDLILAREGVPVARLTGVEIVDRESRQKAIEDIKAFRAKMPRITQAEIAEWKALGRK